MAGDRVCQRCGEILVGKQKKWCSAKCQKWAGRETHLMRCFGITSEQYDLILEEQDGGCGICRRKPKPGKSLAVDHRHTEGRSGPITGLLCYVCNKRFLGARKEEIIIAMYEYITDPPARRALGEDIIAPGRPQKKRKSRKGSTRRKR